jgi:hypothetical protein
MESITKNRQPEQILRAMTERAYGPAQIPAAGTPLGCTSRRQVHPSQARRSGGH